MENNEIMTSEIELAEVNTAEEATESSEQGFDVGAAVLATAAIGGIIAVAIKLGKVIYKKVEPKITANQIKKLEKKEYEVYKLEPEYDEPVEETDIAEESEDDSIENE